MKKLLNLVWVLGLTWCMATPVLAGGSDNKQNFSAAFAGSLSRNAATEGADVAAYNPGRPHASEKRHGGKPWTFSRLPLITIIQWLARIIPRITPLPPQVHSPFIKPISGRFSARSLSTAAVPRLSMRTATPSPRGSVLPQHTAPLHRWDSAGTKPSPAPPGPTIITFYPAAS